MVPRRRAARGSLAFDNDEILHYALQRLRNKVEYAHVAFQFLPPSFTMAQLRAVYEVILGRRIDPTNFRRRVEATGTIVPTGSSSPGGRHRPPGALSLRGRSREPGQDLRPRRVLRSSPAAFTASHHFLSTMQSMTIAFGLSK